MLVKGLQIKYWMIFSRYVQLLNFDVQYKIKSRHPYKLNSNSFYQTHWNCSLILLLYEQRYTNKMTRDKNFVADSLAKRCFVRWKWCNGVCLTTLYLMKFMFQKIQIKWHLLLSKQDLPTKQFTTSFLNWVVGFE